MNLMRKRGWQSLDSSGILSIGYPCQMVHRSINEVGKTFGFLVSIYYTGYQCQFINKVKGVAKLLVYFL